jgi:7-cyano-7-deazaguanine synthase
MNMDRNKALVVLSGGQDSTTALFYAKMMYDEVHCLTFDYDQRHHIEIQAAKKIATMAGVRSHEIVILGPVLKGASPLTNSTEKLETYSDYAEMDGIIGERVELTFVPMRNALFLTLAANRAVVLGAATIVTGVCEADNANYPDCRGKFIMAQERAINEALGLTGLNAIQIITPLIKLTKARSIALAKTLPGCMEALAYSHTAYSGEYPPVTQDHATVLRAQGFLEACTPDPLIVRAHREGLMALPETANYDVVRTELGA